VGEGSGRTARANRTPRIWSNTLVQLLRKSQEGRGVELNLIHKGVKEPDTANRKGKHPERGGGEKKINRGG